ncbi:hypothetical protein C8J57DRAFT_1525799 [Mycena rebaudengoi]|nr:hypothetical protein C8J57DRAFT_1525799 [Mycena rebaudengoi]
MRKLTCSQFCSDIPNLIKVKGLPHIVELIGRTDDDRIVFPKLVLGERLALAMAGIGDTLSESSSNSQKPSSRFIPSGSSVATLLSATSSHNPTNQTAYLCDLECCYGSSDCPEIADAFARNLDLSAVPLSENSDVYMFSRLMADCILTIVLACVAIGELSALPSMQQVKAMLEAMLVQFQGKPKRLVDVIRSNNGF